MRLIAGTIVLLITAFVCVQAAIGVDVDCLVSKYNDYADAQEHFQNDMHNLIMRFNEGHREVSELYRDDQLARIEMSRLAVGYLLTHKIDAVHYNKPMNMWLDLTEDDESLISSNSKRFKKLGNEIRKFRRRPPHPDGDGLREMMRSKVIGSEGFIRLTEGLQQRINQIDAMTCKQ